MTVSRDQRISDFWQLASKMLARYDITCSGMKLVSDLNCVIFYCELEGGQFPRATLRFYPSTYGGIDNVRHEISWLGALAQQTELIIPEPIAARDGSTIQVLPDKLHNTDCCVLLNWVPGKHYYQELTSSHLFQVGRFTGQLHNQSEHYVQQVEFPKNRYACYPELEAWIAKEYRRPEWFSDGDGQILAAAATRLHEMLDNIGRNQVQYGLIHGDLHVSNILIHSGEVGVIDFSDCGWGHHMFEIASILMYFKYPLIGKVAGDAPYNELFSGLMEGYTGVRNLPDNWEQTLDDFILMRIFVTLDWMVGYWPKPDYLPWGQHARSSAVQILKGFL
jgi:Ser/Thr protein kinase RdoA (MazF antagonist)